jgi:protein-S-isoprenylcysteine O-methyltransferase Ste14
MVSPKEKPATVVPPPLVYPIGLGLGCWIDRYVPLDFHGGVGLRAVALLLVTVGLILIVWAGYTIWQHHTTVNPYRGVTCLVSVGPFAFSRNPIYAGDWLIYAGISLLLKPWWTVALTPVIWWIMRYQVIAHEEAHLEAKFGDAFLQYKARVRRWI